MFGVERVSNGEAGPGEGFDRVLFDASTIAIGPRQQFHGFADLLARRDTQQLDTGRRISFDADSFEQHATRDIGGETGMVVHEDLSLPQHFRTILRVERLQCRVEARGIGIGA